MLGLAGADVLALSSEPAPGVVHAGVISRCFFGCVLWEWGGSYMFPPHSCAFCSHESYFVFLVTNHAFGLHAPLWAGIVI